MKVTLMAVAMAALGTVALAAPAPGDGAPADAKVYFVGLKDGDVVPPKLHLKFGLDKMTVRRAGEDIFDRRSGHHHLLVDQGPVPKGHIIMFGDDTIHYGQGQTEADITLKPGPHSLTLQFADGAHSSYGPTLSSTVHILVDANAK